MREPTSEFEKEQLAYLAKRFEERFGYPIGHRVEIEIKPHTLSPRLWYLLTGRRMPKRYIMAYYAREWSRKLTEIFHRTHTKA